MPPGGTSLYVYFNTKHDNYAKAQPALALMPNVRENAGMRGGNSPIFRRGA